MVFDCTCAWWAASVGFDKRNLMGAHKDEPRIMSQQQQQPVYKPAVSGRF
jgi:hypothetical protein